MELKINIDVVAKIPFKQQMFIATINEGEYKGCFVAGMGIRECLEFLGMQISDTDHKNKKEWEFTDFTI